MNEIDDLQELMWDARERWPTIRTTLRERLTAARSGEAFDRFEAQESPGTFVRLGPESEPPPFLTKELRGWARKPYGWRVETERLDGASYVKVCDRAWRPDLTYHGCGPEETESPNLAPLDKLVTGVFDPRIALTELEVVRLVGEEARRSHTGPFIPAVLGRGWTAHDFELLADAERRMPLRSSALLDGQEFARLEVVEVAFEVDVPEDVLHSEEAEWIGPTPKGTDETVPRP